MPRRVPSYRPPALGGNSTRHYRQSPQRKALEDFYNRTPWRRLRAHYLAAHPFCEDCLGQGLHTAAMQVHHKRAITLHWDLRYDWDNLESLCIACHNAKRG